MDDLPIFNVNVSQRQLLPALAKEFFHRTGKGAAIGLVSIAVVLLPHWDVVDHGVLMLWSALLYVPLITSAFYGPWALKAIDREYSANTLVNWECVIAGFGGAVWGVMPLMLDTGSVDSLFYYRLMLLCITIVFLIPTIALFLRAWVSFSGVAWAILLATIYTLPYTEPMRVSLVVPLVIFWFMTLGMAYVDKRRTGVALRNMLTIKELSNSLSEREHVLKERVIEQTAELTSTVESLREREALLSNSQKLAKVGYFVYDAEKGRFRTSPVLEEIVGLTEASERTIASWMNAVHPEDRERIRQLVSQPRNVDADADAETEMTYRIQRRVDGAVRWVRTRSLRKTDAEGNMLSWFGNMQDITEQKDAEQKIHTLAFYDPLTQLPNRRLLQERVKQAIVACKRSQAHGALMMLDLDNFKTINDTRGHAVGDQLLVEVAQRIRASLRGVDSAGRLGGDEFVVMVENLDPEPKLAAEQADQIAEKVRSRLSQPYLLNDRQFHCSTSIGVTLFDFASKDAQALLGQADLALYGAKDAGRNAIKFFDISMQETVARKAHREEGLRHAIDREELVLYYQPQVDHSGYIKGAEALLRWITTEGVAISPAEFIPLAEESELILHIGAWVLDTGCAQLKRWQSNPTTQHLRLAINVSARQLLDPAFPNQVAETIKRHNIRPEGLKLELTESVVMGDMGLVVQRMRDLRSLGLSFALDDFGTGYSSLSYLRHLPLDQLKIDQSFVRDMERGAHGTALLQAIVNIGTSLHLEIIAEGVETPEQRQFLIESGCTFFQGYLFGRPLPIEKFPVGPLGPP
jgi:diguanylate cyclase (GGDEF)-like protein/PAS domain S-box-containing protein